MKYSLDLSNFLEDISSLSQSIFLPYFFALFILEGLLISLCYTLELCILYGVSFPFLLLFAFLLSLAICKASSNHFASCISFSLGWFWSLPPVQCYKPLSIVPQTLCLPDLIL